MKWPFWSHWCFVTRGQFWPSGIVVACVCLCVLVRPCVNHELVRAITHHPFKLGSPNLDHRCKRPIVLGGDWPWPSRSNLSSKSKFTPFWACPCHNSPRNEVVISKFGTKMHLSTIQITTNFGLDWNWSSIKFLISNPDQIELSFLCTPLAFFSETSWFESWENWKNSGGVN